MNFNKSSDILDFPEKTKNIKSITFQQKIQKFVFSNKNPKFKMLTQKTKCKMFSSVTKVESFSSAFDWTEILKNDVTSKLLLFLQKNHFSVA